MPRSFFFLEIVVTVQPAITSIYSEDYLPQKKAADSTHSTNTKKKTPVTLSLLPSTLPLLGYIFKY